MASIVELLNATGVGKTVGGRLRINPPIRLRVSKRVSSSSTADWQSMPLAVVIKLWLVTEISALFWIKVVLFSVFLTGKFEISFTVRSSGISIIVSVAPEYFFIILICPTLVWLDWTVSGDLITEGTEIIGSISFGEMERLNASFLIGEIVDSTLDFFGDGEKN